MRGKLPVLRRQLPGPGLIPAHAGKTSPPPSDRGTTWAHPRSCGENSGLCARRVAIGGSSPLMRGKRNDNDISDVERGLIPAHAGKTMGVVLSVGVGWAHPRSCGENEIECHLGVILAGSSPLMRGKPLTAPLSPARQGLIPAHAGKTTPPPEAREPLWAHPRSCGENTPPLTPPVKRLGSSPLTRGKHRNRPARHDRSRLIPAHAGKTLGCRRA